MSFGTWLYTKLRGEKIGEDQFGNAYYISKRKRTSNREERWVIFNGEVEASKVPPEWHAWLHHTTDDPIPSENKPWQREHLPNLTGTEEAYFPPGHDVKGGNRAKATGDYEPWTP